MHQSPDPADDFVEIDDLDFDYQYVGSGSQQGFNINDDGTVTIIMDDSGPWPFPQGVTPGGSGSSSGGTFAPTSGTVKVNPKVNFIGNKGTAVVKTNISYVIVCEDGTTLELVEQNPITPKEMIGITKFINSVSSFLAVIIAHGGGATVNVKWSELADNLGIRRHFIIGPPKAAYDTTGDTIYVFLPD